MPIPIREVVDTGNLLRFIIIKAKYERARFFFRTNKGKISYLRIMEQAEVKEATAKRWEKYFREEWRNK